MRIQVEDKNLHMEGPINELTQAASKIIAALTIAAYEQNPDNPKVAGLELSNAQEDIIDQLVSMAKEEYVELVKSKNKGERVHTKPLPKPKPTTLKKLMQGHQASKLEEIVSRKHHIDGARAIPVEKPKSKKKKREEKALKKVKKEKKSKKED